MAGVRQSADADPPGLCQIVAMQREFRAFLGAFAALLMASGSADAQLQGGPDWDAGSRELRGGGSGPSLPVTI